MLEAENIQKNYDKHLKIIDTYIGERATACKEMIKHMEEAMTHSGFYDPNDPRMTQRRMRQIFRQANLDAAQVNMLRGMWNSVLQLPKGPHSKC